MGKPLYAAEIGKLNGRYLARVLKDGILLWQSRRTFEHKAQALTEAKKFIKRVEEPEPS